MCDIKYVTDDFLDEFKTNFEEKYLEFYKNNDYESIKEVFTNSQNVIKSEKNFKYIPLKISEDNDGLNVENIKRIRKSLGFLTPSEASNEKLWVALENTDFLDFHLHQFGFVKEQKIDNTIKARTIFTQGRKRSLFMNNLSMLWWLGYYTFDDESDSPYYYTEYFLESANRGDILTYMSSNIVSNKEIVLGTLQAVKELEDENKMKLNRYTFTNSNKILNQIGGVRIIDTLSRREVKEILVENLLDTKNIKK
ncbi:DUF6339 family protein [Staphylococcus simulans]|uniref:DUF6339 family protein n=1 Tax=Staphylococcus simulans TaxID=1286 RepID=UPI0021D2F376|nr:DUF6339 family protein [Staphylococcus simulans]UXV37758.1 DUF6339 family protein [Staphylococcus simulans]UXV40206.1 DUF6339 family protein [Staphylococcus simulans]